MRSDKPEARKFQDWVTREVRPAIRKDGMYVAAYFGKRHDHVLRDIGTLLPKIGGQSLTTEIDDEPCVLDTDLADRVGDADPRMIRKLINRNITELVRHGIISVMEQNTRKRGRYAKA